MKSKIWFITKFVLMACVINLLIACTNSQGQDIGWVEWMFKPEGGETTGHLGSFLSSVGQIVGGPWGYALAGVGAATAPAYKWYHHDKSATGLIQATQEARGALDPEARKVFDDTAREAMNNATSGNLRTYIRNKKDKLRKSGKMALEKFSDKHTLIEIAKKAVDEVS